MVVVTTILAIIPPATITEIMRHPPHNHHLKDPLAMYRQHPQSRRQGMDALIQMHKYV